MSVTAVLSMWISNTATTAMMVPIAQSVAQQLLGRARKDVPPTTTDAASPGPSPQGSAEAMLRRKAERKDSLQTPPLGHMERRDSRLAGRIMAPSEEADEPKLQLSQLSPSEANIAKALLVCIAFAANIGGTATITGTPPNLVTVGILEKAFPGADTGVNFASWLQFAVPLMLVTLSMCWLILVLVFLGPSALLCRAKASDGAQSAEVESRMRRRYESLPKISFAEVSVLCCFLILLFLWILRDPGQFPGFGTLFKSEPRTGKPFVTDATSAVLVGVLLFALPERWPRRGSEAGALMDWRAMQENFPWSVVLLLGGGFALAAGVKESGLSGRIGGALEGLGGLSLGGMQLVCALLTMAVSNVCSNTVTASIFVPIVAGLAVQLGVHPLHLTLPVGLSCSLAFCLPVATPPNAIAFASGLLSVGDLAKAGLPVSLASALLVLANQHSIGTAMFGSDFPQWANATATP